MPIIATDKSQRNTERPLNKRQRKTITTEIRLIGIQRSRKLSPWILKLKNRFRNRFFVSICRNGTNSSAKQESNPFDEEEWDEDSGEPLVDNGEPGVPVKALYDYEGAEADELSFKQGLYFQNFFKVLYFLCENS